MNKPIVILIVGPTAMGKTSLGVELCRAIRGEVISADSMQVYRGMRILSQAPVAHDKKGIPHYLVGSLSAEKEYSAAIFRTNAARLIKKIINKKKIPVVVGGTGLYVKALCDGLFPSPPEDTVFRSSMEKRAAKYGSSALYDELARIDPSSAKKIHPNDKKRLIRALELHHLTGRTMSDLKKDTKGLSDSCNILFYGLVSEREDIYSRIDSRVDRMLKDGVLGEVKRLSRKKLSKTARSVLGFKEISGYLDGVCSLSDAIELLKRNTRRYAKRQLTWFRPDNRIKWLDIKKTKQKSIINAIVKDIRKMQKAGD